MPRLVVLAQITTWSGLLLGLDRSGKVWEYVPKSNSWRPLAMQEEGS